MPERGGALRTGGGSAWWGAFELSPGETRFWQIGPFCLWITRRRREWRLDYRRNPDRYENALTVAGEAEGPPADPGETLRVGYRETAPEVRVEPACPDRPLLVRPASPFVLAPGEDVRLIMSIPLWVQIRSGRSTRPMLDVPCFPVSDSWFGPSTMVGEICYASSTSARLELAEFPLRPQRAMMAADIFNEADTPLFLDRVRIPVTQLSLFQTAEDVLWTEVIRLHRSEGGTARLSLGQNPPDGHGGDRVGRARDEARTTLLTRTFGGLLGPQVGPMDD